ncbi:histone-lysine N-methyltransferase SETMAR [Trichonephila clavipes]|nr:histone-lysine N-methyltransferase SETMAR [Trichonephila clavipes]
MGACNNNNKSCCELQGVKNGSQKEKIRYILQFFFDKDANASQVAEIGNSVYGAVTVTTYCVQFWFHRFRSGIFDVKVAPRTGRPVIKNVDKITEIIEVGRHVRSRSIVHELKIDHKSVLSHLSKVGLKKKLDVWVPHQLTPKKHDESNFHLRNPGQTE